MPKIFKKNRIVVLDLVSMIKWCSILRKKYFGMVSSVADDNEILQRNILPLS